MVAIIEIQPNVEHAPSAIYGCKFIGCAEQVSYPPEMLSWFPGLTDGAIHENSQIAKVVVEPGFYCEFCIEQTIAEYFDADDDRLTRFRVNAPKLAQFIALQPVKWTALTSKSEPTPARGTKTRPNPSFGCEMCRCKPDCPYYGT